MASKATKRKAKGRPKVDVPAGKRTPRQARAWLVLQGITIKDFSEKNGFSRYTVSEVLSGACKGAWGEAHRVAIALGIKPAPSDLS